MNNNRAKILTHVVLVAAVSSALFAVSRPWDALTLTVLVLGVSSGVLSLQIMWAELRRATPGHAPRG